MNDINARLYSIINMEVKEIEKHFSTDKWDLNLNNSIDAIMMAGLRDAIKNILLEEITKRNLPIKINKDRNTLSKL